MRNFKFTFGILAVLLAIILPGQRVSGAETETSYSYDEIELELTNERTDAVGSGIPGTDLDERLEFYVVPKLNRAAETSYSYDEIELKLTNESAGAVGGDIPGTDLDDGLTFYVAAAEKACDISVWLSEDGNYVYPLTPNDPGWKEMGDYMDKVKACKIPQKVLENLSDEQLMQAIIDYPLIYDVFFFSDVNKGVEHLEKTCDAFAELLKREGAKDVLFDTIMSMATDESIGVIAEDEENDSKSAARTARDEIVFDTLVAITIFQEKVGSELLDEELMALTDVSAIVDIYEQTPEMGKLSYSADVIRTPNGTIVNYVLIDRIRKIYFSKRQLFSKEVLL